MVQMGTQPIPQGGTAMVQTEASRKVAEVQAAMVVAQQFPRNTIQACSRIMDSCKRVGLAASATYRYSKGGTAITGPSIRLAEVLAREWGNLQFGVDEIEQRDGQ